MSSSYLRRRTSSTTPSALSEDDIQKMMLQKACELFAVCDVEQKGFITKRDMQRLQKELPLTSDQLVDVFDSLDDDKNGFLTLEEFTAGFGSFLGITSPSTIEKDKSLDGIQESNENVVYGDDQDYHDGRGEDDGDFQELLNDIGATEVLEDVDGIKTLWGRLKQDQPELLANFEDFLQRITSELKRTHIDYRSLQVAMRNKAQSHDEEMRKLYEEMETQIHAEKQRILAEERAKERQQKEQLEKELKEKDKQLQELLNHHQQMQDRLQELNSQDTETKQENEKLQKEKQELEDMLEESERHLDDSRSYIGQLRLQQKEDKRSRALAALQVTEGIAMERETLVKQLDLLRDMNRKLRDERDEAEIRRLAGSQDMGEFSERAPDLSRAASTNASMRESDSALDSCSVSSAGTGVVSPVPAGCDIDLFLRRQQLMKRGSVLSNYISESIWRPHNESDIEVDEEAEYEENHVVTGSSFEGKQSTGAGAKQFVSRHNRVSHSGTSHQNRDEDDVSDCEDVGYSGSDAEGCNKHRQRRKIPREARSSRCGNAAISRTNTHERSRKLSAMEIEAAAPERVFKVVFVGDSGVGKSSFIHQFCSNNFKTAFQATIGVDFQIKNIKVDDHIVAIQVWDTAGQERFRSITKQYFRKADGVLVMYDVTCEASFRNVRNWMSSVQDGTEDGTVLLIAGNKMDLVDENTPQVVSQKDGARIAEEFGSLFYETSAKSGLCVQDSLEAMAKLLCEREDQEMEKVLQLSESTTPRKRGCCN